MSRGKFIVLEGGDGVGKTTQVKLLTDWLTGQGIEHVVTRQPGGTPLGNRLRDLVLDPEIGEVAVRAEALIYAADKAQHVMEVVEPALERGLVVISDRFIDSMIAYQGAGRGVDVDEIEKLALWATGGLRPDLTLLLDAHPGDAMARLTSKDRLEQAGDAFHAQVREYYLQLAHEGGESYSIIDSQDTPQRVSANIIERVSQLLG